MNQNQSSYAILQPQNNVGYGSQDLPSTRDGEIRDLILHLADNDSFDHVTHLIPDGADLILGAYAHRAATIAVRRHDPRELRAGLIAAALAEPLSSDPREVIPALALLYRAAIIIGHDPDPEFATVNSLTGDRAPGLAGFTRRTPHDRTIQVMGYQESEDKDGFRFTRTW